MLDPLEGRGPDGTIVTGAERHRVPTAFEPVLAACIAAVSDPRVSVHLYGSVATGTAHIGGSDVDLLAVGLHPETGRAVQEQLSEQFRHLTRAVEIAVAQPEDFVGEDDQPYGNRVFLKHYCVLLAGPDRRSALAAAAADARAARGFNGDIGRRYQVWRTSLAQPAEQMELNTAVLGRRVARKTLLAVAGLVSVHDTTWTTDRVSAAYRWTQLHPSHAPGVHNLVQWSEGIATPTFEELNAALAVGGIVNQVVDDFRAAIGLWT